MVHVVKGEYGWNSNRQGPLQSKASLRPWVLPRGITLGFAEHPSRVTPLRG